MTTENSLHLRDITDENRDAVLALKVKPTQNQFVASVAQSLRDAENHPEAKPWYRAIYDGDEPVGFVMMSWKVPPGQPGIFGPYFLWRLLVDERHQRRGVGRAGLSLVIDLAKKDGATELLTSYQPGDGEPWPFYQGFGFEPTGELDGTEILLRLDLTKGSGQ